MAGISITNGTSYKLNVITTDRKKGGVPIDLPGKCFYSFVELPKPMNKLEVANYLLGHTDFQDAGVLKYLKGFIAKLTKESAPRVASNPNATQGGIDAIKAAVKKVVRQAAKRD